MLIAKSSVIVASNAAANHQDFVIRALALCPWERAIYWQSISRLIPLNSSISIVQNLAMSIPEYRSARPRFSHSLKKPSSRIGMIAAFRDSSTLILGHPSSTRLKLILSRAAAVGARCAFIFATSPNSSSPLEVEHRDERYALHLLSSSCPSSIVSPYFRTHRAKSFTPILLMILDFLKGVKRVAISMTGVMVLVENFDTG